MTRVATNPIVHLELQTGNLPQACAFFTQQFGWSAKRVTVGRCWYLALDLSDGVDGGVVERDSDRCLWLPYVEVTDVAEATERARLFGASVLLDPREGAMGWRSVVPEDQDRALHLYTHVLGFQKKTEIPLSA